MKLAIISDTHTKHEAIHVPKCDILIHCGDYTNRGSNYDVKDFLSWFVEQDAKHFILIHGNHDIQADPKFNPKIAKGEGEWPSIMSLFPEVNLLENSGCEINGVKFWGSAVTPWFFGEYWGFNRHRGEEIKKTWDLIPNNTDVLITHGPPYGKLDLIERPNVGEDPNRGCEELMKKVEIIKPKIHCFGHLHLEGGQVKHDYNLNTTFINAAMLDEQYEPTRNPIEIEI